MIIDTRNVELSENVFVDKEGKFLFRIDKFEDDGFTNSGDARFKLFFKGVEVGTKEPVYLHSEQFNIGQKSLWRIKQLEVALKAPEIYDVNDFIGRYVIATIKKENYIKSDGSAGHSFKVKTWEYSSLNDKMPPIPEAKQDSNDDTTSNDEVSDSQIPF